MQIVTKITKKDIEEYYTIKEVQNILKLRSQRTIYKYIKDGKLNAVKIGSGGKKEQFRISQSELWKLFNGTIKNE